MDRTLLDLIDSALIKQNNMDAAFGNNGHFTVRLNSKGMKDDEFIYLLSKDTDKVTTLHIGRSINI